MRFVSLLLLALCSISAMAQQHTIHGKTLAGFGFKIMNDGGATYALFSAAKDRNHMTYRKVFLGPNLKPLDSVDFDVPGKAWLRGTSGDKNFTYHAFSVIKPFKGVWFVITDKQGNVKYSFGTPKKALKLHEQILIYRVDPIAFIEGDKLIVQVLGKVGTFIVAINVKDGSIAWRFSTPYLYHIQQTDSMFIGLSHTYYSKHHITTIHFFDKFSGKKINEVELNPHRRDFRQIGAVACNGKNLIVAGERYRHSKSKHSHFFLTCYDLKGNQVFEKIDSADRLNKYRISVMGSAFDSNGNLVLMGEAYKPNVKKEVEMALVGAILTFGVGAFTIQEIDKVEFITATAVSPETGELQYFRSYPIEPSQYFAQYFNVNSYVMMRVLDKTFFYNADTPEIPPIRYANVGYFGSISITPFGPVLVRFQGMNTAKLNIIERDR